MPTDLRLVSSALSKPPFNKSFSPIQLHDEVPHPQLLQLITDVAAHLDEGTTNGGNSIHKVDIRGEDPESTAWRITDLLRILRFPIESNTLRPQLLTNDRMILLDILYFLLKDIPTHKKRMYLAPFLEVIDIPMDFMQDDTVVELNQQVAALQEQFKEMHKYIEGLRQTGGATSTIKREIQQMEEEKQQVLSKIGKIKKKVENMPNHEVWLEAAKNLRLEQQTEMNLSEKIREQRNAVQNADKKYTQVQQTLKDVRVSFGSAGPEALFSKMQEEFKMNKYLASENLPKSIEDSKQKIRDLNRVISEPPLSDADLVRYDQEIKVLNEEIAKLAEKRLLKNNSGDDKLALFRQQAAIIARKKEGTAQKLNGLMEELGKLTEELEKKKEQSKGSSGTKMLKGEDFKRYVSELRGKSMVYKRKKAELSEITAEFGILQRTEEILMNRKQGMSATLTEMEKRSGVVGYHADRENLEKVSERKSELDEVKGKTLNEISDIISSLMTTINEKKQLLAPVIQELRSLRALSNDLESDYLEKKKYYDAIMVGIDSEAMQLDQEVRTYKQDIASDQSRYHYLHTSLNLSDIAQERSKPSPFSLPSLEKVVNVCCVLVLQEMKAYIGGDDIVELQQKARGFRSYRDVYNKKVQEQENLGKSLRETQKEVKAKHEPNMKQLALLADVKKLLVLKAKYNSKVISGGGTLDLGFEGGQMTQDRLVL
ncbi:Intraflagellar transport protein 81 [Chytridiales sp. JEL 0842]|nr:Intraflagellar transport protein 81 [Chytridiales sp. JEL 0842]